MDRQNSSMRARLLLHSSKSQAPQLARAVVTRGENLVANASCAHGRVIACFLYVTVQAAVADDSSKPASTNTLAEVIVTAQKREQDLQSTALAITAITGGMLPARGIDNGLDLQLSAPSISMGASVAGSVYVTLRGVGMGNIYAGGDPGVPIHVDGHYIQSSNYILRDFLDIERVEILRGPQGTLYGRNAVGGSINMSPFEAHSNMI